jgi:hypothetical protein
MGTARLRKIPPEKALAIDAGAGPVHMGKVMMGGEGACITRQSAASLCGKRVVARPGHTGIKPALGF